MKKAIIILGTVLFICCMPLSIYSQMNRTLETKVADILAQFPTKDLKHSDKLMKEIMTLDTEGILQFTDMLVPLGSGDDTNARYAIQSLAIYAGGLNNKIGSNVAEQALLQAIEKAGHQEVKTFLIDRLVFCGSNNSIKLLNDYLKGELFEPALSALTAIGTPEASKVIFEAAKISNGDKQIALIDALGVLKYKPAAGFIQGVVSSGSKDIQPYALTALSEIASTSSKDVLISAAKQSYFKLDDSKAIIALIQYATRLNEHGNSALSAEVAELILKHATSEDQLHFRSAAIHLLSDIKGAAFIKTLLKEAKNPNEKYSASVIDVASKDLTSVEVNKWVKAYKKYPDTTKPFVIRMLSGRTEAVVFDKCILPALEDRNEFVRVSGIKALSSQEKDKALPVLLQLFNKNLSSSEYKALEETLLRVVSTEDSELLANRLEQVDDAGKKVLVNVLSKRNATDQFKVISGLLNTSNEELKSVVYTALPSVSSTEDLPELITVLSAENNTDNIENIQKAIVNVLDAKDETGANTIYRSYKAFSDTSKLTPILAALSTDKALDLVSEQLQSGDANSKQNALKALANWKQNYAIPLLFETVIKTQDSGLKQQAFTYYLNKAITSDYPDDQKLLLVKKLLPYSPGIQEKKQIISAASKVKTFLSLVFVSEFLDNPGLLASASNAAIRIALPTPGKKNGLSGDVVRDIVSRSVNNLTGQDSQYIKIDVKEFLENMPSEKGFVSIFNGKDLSGWEGLVENPIARAKMSKRELAKAQAKANEQMLKDWFVKDGIIGFKGEGYNNICTIKDYGDFEMLVDWKITNGGDSGIYLRGTPQVQIWDIARTNVGAQVGSGGLYNNQKHERIPLEVADNPINEWNTFRIKMVGERVTVYLNGVLVTDNVILENYWDRKLPIFTKEAIELQAHGEDLGFRNIYVREIESGDILLSEEEKKAGFKSLFNGKDLDHWIGNKTDYVVENNEIFVNPKQGGHGNLYTAEEYSDFIFRFEFKLTPGANNGLGIHTPLEGDAAYVGKELQILDNTAAIYKNLKPYQYHGSVYGVIAAKRGFLKPVGEWNIQEVIVKGDDIKITLNGNVIVDDNMAEASKNGTADKTDHPGLKRKKGHIGFLGHGSELWFRNIRVKAL
ncbi:DUF1080 domain-containing protein [Tamlana sp. 2201CG12-4]|uniref:DUF1080 domain-containing protein n=1 Tax=Tamlana sp. 2201CG12-4 TaxID=3112582 RepID=UPI002DBF1050|nr:DUF1080 domain-containing protein [Tamlana sp. 2201CG12-4]MEC3907039.1 DUF1080 domain-containing protein [Tamlana sp. 2201CG12-4]